MAPHSSTFAWKIPWMEEPGGLQSLGPYESDTTERLHFHTLEKEMATHSSVLAWRIPGTGKPCGLPSRGQQESDRTEATQQQQWILFWSPSAAWHLLYFQQYKAFTHSRVGTLLNNDRTSFSRNSDCLRFICGIQSCCYLNLQCALPRCVFPFCP